MRRLVLFSLLAVTAAGASALVLRPATAAVRPLCGPTYLWTCTLRSGQTKTVAGTICDINKYMQKTGATCVHSSL